LNKVFKTRQTKSNFVWFIVLLLIIDVPICAILFFTFQEISVLFVVLIAVLVSNMVPNRWGNKSELFLVAGIAAIFLILNSILVLKFAKYTKTMTIFLGIVFMVLMALFFGIVYFTQSIVKTTITVSHRGCCFFGSNQLFFFFREELFSFFGVFDEA
jgi:hypothetical protein